MSPCLIDSCPWPMTVRGGVNPSPSWLETLDSVFGCGCGDTLVAAAGTIDIEDYPNADLAAVIELDRPSHHTMSTHMSTPMSVHESVLVSA